MVVDHRPAGPGDIYIFPSPRDRAGIIRGDARRRGRLVLRPRGTAGYLSVVSAVDWEAAIICSVSGRLG